MTLTPVKLKRDKVDLKKLHITPERLNDTRELVRYLK